METKMFFRKMLLTSPLIFIASMILFPNNQDVISINFILMGFFLTTWIFTKDNEE